MMCFFSICKISHRIGTRFFILVFGGLKVHHIVITSNVVVAQPRFLIHEQHRSSSSSSNLFVWSVQLWRQTGNHMYGSSFETLLMLRI